MIVHPGVNPDKQKDEGTGKTAICFMVRTKMLKKRDLSITGG